jgi:DNA polymerase III sliding clamp (beta) subunit (PCNA family)
MKFSIPKAALVTALTRCEAIAERKASMPILCCVLLEPCTGVLKVSATDLETGYTTAVDGIEWEDSL